MSLRPRSSLASTPPSLTPVRTLKEVLSVTPPSASVDVCLIKPSSNPNDANSTCNDLKTIRKDRLQPPKKLLLDVPRREQSEMKDDERPDSPSSMRPTPPPKQPEPQLTPSTSMEVDLENFKGPTKDQENQIMNNVFEKIDRTPVVFVPDILDPQNARGGEAASVASAYAIAELMHEFGVMDDELYEDANYVSGALLVYLASDRNKPTQAGESDPNSGRVQPMDISASYAKGVSVSGVLTKEDKEKLSRHVYQGGEGLFTTALKVKFEGIIKSFKSMVDNFKKKNYISALKDASLLTAKTVSMIGANTLAAAGVPTTFNLGDLPGGDRIKDLQAYVGDKVPTGFLERADVAKNAVGKVSQMKMTFFEKLKFSANPLNAFESFPTAVPTNFQSFVDSLWLLEYVAGPHVRVALYAAVTVLQVLDNYGRNNLGSIRKFLTANRVEDFRDWKDEILKAVDEKFTKPERKNIEAIFEEDKKQVERSKEVLKTKREALKKLETELKKLEKQKTSLNNTVPGFKRLKDQIAQKQATLDRETRSVEEMEKSIEDREEANNAEATRRNQQLTDQAKDDEKWMNDRLNEFKEAFAEVKEYVRLQADKKEKDNYNFDEFEWGEGVRFSFDILLPRFGQLKGVGGPVKDRIERVDKLILQVKEFVKERGLTDEDLQEARAAIDAKKKQPSSGTEIPKRKAPRKNRARAAAAAAASDDSASEDDDDDDDDGAGVGIQ